jgi:hypothetical protein
MTSSPPVTEVLQDKNVEKINKLYLGCKKFILLMNLIFYEWFYDLFLFLLFRLDFGVKISV